MNTQVQQVTSRPASGIAPIYVAKHGQPTENICCATVAVTSTYWRMQEYSRIDTSDNDIKKGGNIGWPTKTKELSSSRGCPLTISTDNFFPIFVQRANFAISSSSGTSLDSTRLNPDGCPGKRLYHWLFQ